MLDPELQAAKISAPPARHSLRVHRLLRKRCITCVDGAIRRRKEFDDLLIELIYHTAERQNVQYALTIGEQVDDLFSATNQGWLVAIDDEVRSGDILTQFILKVREHFADLLETNP